MGLFNPAFVGRASLKMPPKQQQKGKTDKNQSQKKTKKPAGSGGKAKKKKWSKGKVRDKLITPSVVSERLKIRVSLARSSLKELLSKGLIREVSKHSAQMIYTRATKESSQ